MNQADISTPAAPGEEPANRWSLTDDETLLRKAIADPLLRASLTSIRYAVDFIWNQDTAPCIIQDGTDHGIDHSKRLTDFVCRLLRANDGRQLSAHEHYLLLAGIYLHDIGMQCDIVAMPEVRTIAERLGATFTAAYPRQRSGDYTIEQQIDLRRNHHYLSAAWLSYAQHTGETDLGHAARSIPQDLVDDLIYVCLYHTRLPISDCPHTFKFDPTGRKQLIAALLRFADELDIEMNRVPFDTIRAYTLNQHNRIYWWLHNRTRVLFIDRTMVRLSLFLHPDDASTYGTRIHAIFINEFQSKNAPVLSVLNKHGIPLAIDSDSRVEEHERIEPLPADVQETLQSIESEHGPLHTLAEEVRAWLRAIRYEVSNARQIDERTIQIHATIDLGTVRQRVLVRCIGGQVTPADVDAMASSLTRKTPQGWLISDRRVSDLARRRVAEDHDDAFEVFTLAEFLQQKVWGSYFDTLTALVEKENILQYAVPLNCRNPEPHPDTPDTHDALDTLDAWLADPAARHITLTGDTGSGRTWLCRRYAHRQLQHYLKDPINERLPLLISLRAFVRPLSADQLINEVLLNHYHLQFVGSASDVFHEMNRRGKLLLILDGFDEMVHHTDNQTVVETFWELARLITNRSKMLLTSHSAFFHWTREAETVLSDGSPPSSTPIILALPHFEVRTLAPLTSDHMTDAITRRIGTEPGRARAAEIRANPTLAALAERPMYIDMLLAALDVADSTTLTSPALVMLHAIDHLLLRRIGTRLAGNTDRVSFLCELAWEMLRSGELRIHYRDIPDRITAFFCTCPPDQQALDTWDNDLRHQAMLQRSAAGHYEFAPGVADFFVAYKLAAEIGCLAAPFLQVFQHDQHPDPPSASQHHNPAALAATFGALPLTAPRLHQVRLLLPDMLAPGSADCLWRVVEQARALGTHRAGFLASNAITLLHHLGQSFDGADLRGLHLHGADLRGCNLHGARIDNATLQGALLDGASIPDPETP